MESFADGPGANPKGLLFVIKAQAHPRLPFLTSRNASFFPIHIY
jgi:hypothetical protein